MFDSAVKLRSSRPAPTGGRAVPGTSVPRPDRGARATAGDLRGA
jgi:hypothetical protein